MPRRELRYEPAALGVGHRLQARVRPQLPVDVVQVIAEGLWRNLELSGDGGRGAPLGEGRKDRLLLAGQGLGWGVVRRLLVDRDDLPGRREHLAEQCFL